MQAKPGKQTVELSAGREVSALRRARRTGSERLATEYNC